MAIGKRERAFMIGAPLAIAPALALLPAVAFLLAFPPYPHLRILGVFVVPLCAVATAAGLALLAAGAVERPWGIFNMLSYGALFVLLVIAGYSGLFLAWITAQL